MRLITVAVDFLGGGLGGKLALALCGIVVAMAAGLWLMFSHIGELNVAAGKLEAQRDEAVRAANNNAAIITAVEAIGERNIAAVGAVLDATVKRADKVNAIIREVNRVKPEDKTPAGCPAVPGPILRALGGVRELRSGDADKGAAGREPGAGAAIELRARSRPAK